MVLQLLMKDILSPLAAFLIDRGIKELLGSFMANIQVTCEIPKIQWHVRLCATPGPHFLEIRNKNR